VKGAAIGLGCDIACMCDIRIAAESARFAVSFLRIGLVPGDGGAWFLPRIVGLSKAAEMSFTGDMLTAEQALACGLVSSIVPTERLLEEAEALAARIAAQPPQALRLSKRLLREACHGRLDDVLTLSAAFQALVQESADHGEAITAMLEKRTPIFTGS
jgi:2-(1,2-epoxy-1,2-dihydrophenyl)acetyl-CoA isomerase